MMIPRRHFLKTAFGSTAVLAMPNIFSGPLFAADSPNKRIQVAQIGCGRMGTEDMLGTMKTGIGRMVAVCDLDSNRLAIAKKKVEEFYKKQGEQNVVVKTYANHLEVIADPEIDAVVVSVPDHWHGLVATAAALAGKHVYCQKPLTYNIAESIALRAAVKASKVILQTGSQQRSESPFPAFRRASEIVRNGRLGKLRTLKIGVGLDKAKGQPPASAPVPATFDYDRWLGPAPEQDYVEARCHSQKDVGARPGWITTEDFGLGMITNWGAHHIDIAQWAMGHELGGPSKINAKADFMKNDVWTVHSTYHIELGYPDDVQVILDNSFENGIRFEGEEGWVFCARGAGAVTASDGDAGGKKKKDNSLRASKDTLLAPLTASEDKRWAKSPDHYRDWLEAIIANREPIAPVDQAAKSLQTCSAAWIGMKLGRPLVWDVAKEAFVNDDEANALRSRKPRKAEFDIDALVKGKV
ncbi:MAG: Gfo/Idh/MocA family oxidoreductase [Verrucomicrobiaceae bacterium]|nr:MAG: Gfo/Idh/MocA family oxidoreductase [Verrucomicrobiaceae bacterium]